jgi:acyl-CoA thioesterase
LVSKEIIFFFEAEPDAFVHQDKMPDLVAAPEQLEDTRTAILRILKEDEQGERETSLHDLQRKYLNRRLVDLDDDDENSPVFIEVSFRLFGFKSHR